VVDSETWDCMSVMSNETFQSDVSLSDLKDYDEMELESGWQNHGSNYELVVHEQLTRQQREISALKEQMVKLSNTQQLAGLEVTRTDSLDLSQFTHMERLVPGENQTKIGPPAGDIGSVAGQSGTLPERAAATSHDPVVRMLLVLLLAIVIGFIMRQNI